MAIGGPHFDRHQHRHHVQDRAGRHVQLGHDLCGRRQLRSLEVGTTLGPDDNTKLEKFKTEGGNEIEAPDNKPVDATTLVTSPDKANVAFVTWVDPCNQDDAPSLYVASMHGGAIRHVLTGRSRFVARWSDNTTLVYEDPEGALRCSTWSPVGRAGASGRRAGWASRSSRSRRHRARGERRRGDGAR